jgi:hypothetical protein
MVKVGRGWTLISPDAEGKTHKGRRPNLDELALSPDR